MQAAQNSLLMGPWAPRLEFLFLMRDVLAAEAAVLVLLELVSRLQTLVRCVVTVLTLGAFEEDVAFLDLHETGLTASCLWCE
jgi:hypothetical protein